MTRPIVYGEMLVVKVTPDHKKRIDAIISMNSSLETPSAVVRAAIDLYYTQALLSDAVRSSLRSLDTARDV